MTDWIGWMLVMHGPWRITCNADHWLGRWCLPRAGAWAYRDVDGETGDAK